MSKVVVAMSGGVDSSLAAALLVEAGHEVIGVTLHLWDDDGDNRLAESLCCSQEIAESARRVCAQLGIPYYVFNYQREFRKHVIDYFVSEYARGYTPNPCLACNRDLKFRALLNRALGLGYEYVATGHYARIQTQDPRPKTQGHGTAELRNYGTENREPRTAGLPEVSSQKSVSLPFGDVRSSGHLVIGSSGQQLPAASHQPPATSYELLRAVDPEKDQSYMLHILGQRELSRLMFPIGGYTKSQVRAMAAERGLSSADRPESQDICFVPGGDYRNLLREERPESLVPGPIVDQSGRQVGQHHGLPLYTVGQRRGLGVAGGQPYYVTELDIAHNALVVGPAAALQRDTLTAEAVTFISGVWPSEPFACQVQIRAHAASIPAHAVPAEDGSVLVTFERPQRAVTPGQAAVFYDGELVLGGGQIAR